tara:strand:- start:284 stop:589 length:306 start_codon:yes stop_codon:yes gene_type:complete
VKKFLTISLILSLILLTAIVKNSTKRIDDMIFVSEENIRDLKKDLENIKLEHDYLSSTEKLIEYQNLYFEDELIKKDIQEIRIIVKGLNNLELKQLEFYND